MFRFLGKIVCLVSLASLGMTQTNSWTIAGTQGPSPRHAGGMVFDKHRSKVIHFGGIAGTSYANAQNDTWEWNGSSWSQATASGPAARFEFAMAYDSFRAQTVVFGGIPSGLNPTTAFGDTWEYDGTTWIQRANSGPTPRIQHSMAYDSLRRKTVLFGGHDYSTNYLGDTWEWDGATWSQIALVGPSPRVEHAMAFDTIRNRTVLFGGSTPAPTPGTGTIYVGDTWEWDGQTWAQVATAGPAPRSAHGLVFDSIDRRAILFGGRTSGAYLGDTWAWNGAGWTQLSNSGPSARQTVGLAYDSTRRAAVLFGGYAWTGTAAGSFFQDTWVLSSANNIPTATATIFGTGCGTPALTCSPVPTALPVLGSIAQAALTNTPSTMAFVSIGWNMTNIGPFVLPFSLLGYGMPGCFILQSSETTVPTAPIVPGVATFALGIPNRPELAGLTVYLQGWAYAPGANSGNTVVSNGLEWGIGS